MRMKTVMRMLKFYATCADMVDTQQSTFPKCCLSGQENAVPSIYLSPLREAFLCSKQRYYKRQSTSGAWCSR